VNYTTGTTPSQPWIGEISAGGSAAAPLGLGGLAERDHRPFEVRGGLEALVDGGEPQVGDRVEDLESLQDPQAQTLALDLSAAGPGFLLDLGGEGLDRFGPDGAAGDGPLDSSDQLGTLEGLTLAGAFDDHERELDDALLGREPAPAGEALATATDRRAVVGGPGIDHLVVVGEAERAAHSITVTLSHREGVGSLTPEGGESLLG
jgi:hypothetical protein